jgi:hypothetical protein
MRSLRNKFRHGREIYALLRGEHVGDLKAASQNLMHSSLQVTDSICSVLSMEDVGERILVSGDGESLERTAQEDLIAVTVKETLRQLR